MFTVAIVFLTMVMAVPACAQTVASPQQPPQANATQTTTAAPADPAHQMELDLNQMESLLNNMAAQVSFVRDTNMSILLNTNVQLWSVLIRDLRLQLQEKQRHAAAPESSSPQRH